ncbi:Crp/Fnr family transcriptional regulator [Bosea sp. MMO-172]|uniref:Crp/Fnr family transcriptional regulator n=1 Tax=Bosea sp. MMO-172 TaxID=3127885 RepID=UPI00301A89BF
MDIFARKLRSLSDIRDSDLAPLRDAARDRKTITPGADIITEGEEPEDVHLILSGFAYRYKLTEDGLRQIFAYLLPGDFCDLHVALLNYMDHSIGTVSPCEVALIPRRKILALIEDHPRIARALWLCNLVDAAVLREWLLNVGRRSADTRIAHLFCEIHERLVVVGMAEPDSFELPIPQAALADTVGLSDVHVNRSLRALREAGVATFRNHTVSIPNIAALRAYAGFESSYLHLRAQPVD